MKFPPVHSQRKQIKPNKSIPAGSNKVTNKWGLGINSEKGY